MIRHILLAIATMPLLHAAATHAQGGPAKPRSRHAVVNGNQIYYEIHGSGKPLILLHGGVATTEVFGPNLEALAQTRQVIAIHLQGHGRTPDVERPLRYELLADDIAALVKELALGKVDLMGHSLGGGVALQTAIRHPTLIDRLVVISAPMQHAASFPEVLAAFAQMEANPPTIARNVQASPMGCEDHRADSPGLRRRRFDPA